MKKTLAVLISTALLAAVPVMALPGAIDETLVHQENIVDPVVTSEQSPQDYWRRYCPRGYILQRYYVRIGNVWVVQYRCVRYYGRGPWSEPLKDFYKNPKLSDPR